MLHKDLKEIEGGYTLYTDLIGQEGGYTYSANIQFDIEEDTKLLRFIPNNTTIKLLREYFMDMIRPDSYNHARILYGSYGTGKSHFLTVLAQLLGKKFTKGKALEVFLKRVAQYDPELEKSIKQYINDEARKPLLIVPIVFDFEDFDRCIYFSLKKKLDSIGIQINYRTFYEQAEQLLDKWIENEESNRHLRIVCTEEKYNIEEIKAGLSRFDPAAKAEFETVFNKMTYGVNFVHEVSNLLDALNQANEAIDSVYSGIVFIFDEFGRYIEDNLRKIKVKSIQDLAEYCDHSEWNNHILLVSHKEISQYTKKYGKSIANEWKKVEGRYKPDSINNRHDQCLSLVRSILIKNDLAWNRFKNQFKDELSEINSESMDLKRILNNASSEGEDPFEVGFPLHPISLIALDRLSKKVAQNDRTFFTYLAGKQENSLYRFLVKHELNEFHYVGIDEIFDYFEDSIKSMREDDSYEWYTRLQVALSKVHMESGMNLPEVKILKVITALGIINDASILVPDLKTLTSAVDCPNDLIRNAIQELCDKKILKYSRAYERYEFFDASIFDVETMIEDESANVSNTMVINTLNDCFVNFVLYPKEYNRTYKISRVFIPVFADLSTLNKRAISSRVSDYYDGLLIMLLSNQLEISVDQLNDPVDGIERAVIWVNNDSNEIIAAVKKYVAIKFLESQKGKYNEKDPAFEKELQYYEREISSVIEIEIEAWKSFEYKEACVVSEGRIIRENADIHLVEKVASELMYKEYPETLIVNNELINKNIVKPSISTAKRNAIRAMLSGSPEENYYDLQYLSPDYISVRSVLANNGYINVSNARINELESGKRPQEMIEHVFREYINKAKTGDVCFEDLYSILKEPPYGLRNGYLSLLFANFINPYRKSLIIISHGTEQEITAELFDEIFKQPADYSFTVANWTSEQLQFLNNMEALFQDKIDALVLSKNRLKAIYDAMLSHYKSVSKFARTTQDFVSDQTKNYRKLLEKSQAQYSRFLLTRIRSLTGDLTSSYVVVADAKTELEQALYKLETVLKQFICELWNENCGDELGIIISRLYKKKWSLKRQKAFDYYTNALLEYAESVSVESSDKEVVGRLAKIVTGIDVDYWSDKHIDEFRERMAEIKEKLDAYTGTGKLNENEIKMTLTMSNGAEKTIIFDNNELSDFGLTIKNKVNSTFGNFGLSVTYDDKVQILLSLLNDLMEGKQ